MGSSSTSIYTSELILCFTICVLSATRHNIHFYYKYRRQEIQQIVEGAASNNRVYYKNLRHAKYRLQAGEYKKMAHAIANNKK